MRKFSWILILLFVLSLSGCKKEEWDGSSLAFAAQPSLKEENASETPADQEIISAPLAEESVTEAPAVEQPEEPKENETIAAPPPAEQQPEESSKETEKQQPEEPSKETEEQQSSETKLQDKLEEKEPIKINTPTYTGSAVNFEAVQKRVRYNADLSALESFKVADGLYRIRSKAELDGFKAAAKNVFGYPDHDNAFDLEKTMNRTYDEAFFAEKALYLYYRYTGSGSLSYSVGGVERNGDTMTFWICYNNLVGDVMMTCDMAGWLNVMEIARADLDGVMKIETTHYNRYN